MGFPFFKPIYGRGTRIRMYGCPFAQQSIKGLIANTMTPPYFPVNFADLNAEIVYQEACGHTFAIDSVVVTPILLSHPNQGLGYKFVEEGKSFVFLTDNELTFRHPGGLDYQDYLAFSAGADLLIHDAEFTEEEYPQRKTWGHTAYPDALRLAMEAEVRRFGLFHHNQERPDAAVDDIVHDCRRIIQNAKARVDCFAVAAGMEVEL